MQMTRYGSSDGPAGTVVGDHARPGTAARARPVRLVPPLGQPVRLAARDRHRGAARPCAVVQGGAARDRGRRSCGQRPARSRGHDRRRRPCPGDGRPARAARQARFLSAVGAQHRAERRLVDVRADHHRHRGRGSLTAPLRLPRQVDVDARLRRDQLGTRNARPDRIRAALPAEVRLIRARLLHDLPDVLGDLEVASARVLGARGQRRVSLVRASR